MIVILCPSDHLTKIVGASGKAIISTREIWKCPHLPVFQDKPEVDKADGIGPGVKGRATPSLPERFRIGSLRNPDMDSLGVFNVPSDAAVWSSEGAEIEYRMVLPVSP